MVQVGWHRKFGRRQQLCCWSEIFRQNCGRAGSEDLNRRNESLLLFAASVQRTTERFDTKRWRGLGAILAADGPSGYFIGKPESQTASGCGQFEIRFIRGSRTCRPTTSVGVRTATCFAQVGESCELLKGGYSNRDRRESCPRRRSKDLQNNQIITAPMRYGRNANQSGEVMQPKVSIIIPGHLGLQIGTYRTDARTTSCVAVQVAVTLAAGCVRHCVSGVPPDMSIHDRAPSTALVVSESSRPVNGCV